MTEPPFHFAYTMQRRDFVALTWAMTPASLASYLVRAVIVLVIGVGLFLIAAADDPGHVINAIVSGTAPSHVYFELAVFALLLVGLAIGLRPLMLISAANRVYSRNAAADKPVSFDITGEAISGGITGIVSTIRWSAVTRLIETRNHLFIAISRREALILPRRAFASNAEFDAFAGWAHARIVATGRPLAG